MQGEKIWNGTSARFTKAHGCGNDFLIVPGLAAQFESVGAFVRSICDRHFGVGADGVYFVSEAPSGEADAEAHLYNSDGSPAELSGNGTRCVAAFLAGQGRAGGEVGASLRIRTGAGVKELRLMERAGKRFRFRMQVGTPRLEPGPDDTWSVWLGNPQCVVFVEDFGFDWQARGRELGRHPFFPAGANVDFVRVLGNDRVEARFWERGAGHTLASGTGSTASAVAAIHSGRAQSPVAVETEGGTLRVEWHPDGEAFLTGPAELICEGEYFGAKRGGPA